MIVATYKNGGRSDAADVPNMLLASEDIKQKQNKDAAVSNSGQQSEAFRQDADGHHPDTGRSKTKTTETS